MQVTKTHAHQISLLVLCLFKGVESRLDKHITQDTHIVINQETSGASDTHSVHWSCLYWPNHFQNAFSQLIFTCIPQVAILKVYAIIYILITLKTTSSFWKCMVFE